MDYIRKNKYDKTDSLEIGNKAERIFIDIAEKRSYSISSATKYQDINEHWDYKLQLNGVIHKVDVKAMKRVSRQDQNVQDEWIWIELHGVRRNDKGWLYGGKSSLIAFEMKDDFIIVPTEELKQLIPEIVSKEYVNKARDAKYKLYQRPGRNDIITQINKSDLEKIIWERWVKNN